MDLMRTAATTDFFFHYKFHYKDMTTSSADSLTGAEANILDSNGNRFTANGHI